MQCTTTHPVQTHHASLRSQQRGVPPAIVQWLSDFGDEVYDGRGGLVRYFGTKGLRRLERAMGRQVVRRMSEFLRCYLVESPYDGLVITVGKRYRNCRLPRH